MKLNLGCGNDYRFSGSWINLDITPPCNFMADIKEGLPFEDRVFDLIWASHILEHLPNLRLIQRELARVMKTGGELKVIVPYFLSADAWGDPTHCRGFSEESFLGCYWVGFSKARMEKREYKKKGTGMITQWLHVDMLRNGLDFWDVSQQLSGDNYVKA